MTVPTPALVPDVPRLALHVRRALAEGRPAAARPMLRVLRGLDADPILLTELDARLAIAEKRLADAIGGLTAALDSLPPAPELAGLHACRAEALLLAGRPGEALRDAADAVVGAPQAWDAKALLGIVLLEANRPADAARCLSDALQGEPENTASRLALAEALHRTGQSADAAFVLQDGISLSPKDLPLRRAAVFHAARCHDFAEAVALAEAAWRAGVFDAAVLGLLGHARTHLGQHAAALDAYRAAFTLDPQDSYVRHMVAAGGATAPDAAAPEAYVRTVFNGYASTFDGHLLALRYRVPGLFRTLIEALPPPRGPVIDLGCGTGLLAVACGDLAGPWTGIDLSPAMLDVARRRELYATLIEGEIVATLPGLPPAALILAADVFGYFGDLRPVLTSVRAHLLPGGYAIFSVERMVGVKNAIGYALRMFGRYVHAETSLREIVAEAGLEIVTLAHEVLRHEHDLPVEGMIVTVRAR